MSEGDPHPSNRIAVRTPLHINRGFWKNGKVFPEFLASKKKNRQFAQINLFIFVHDDILFDLLLCDPDPIPYLIE